MDAIAWAACAIGGDSRPDKSVGEEDFPTVEALPWFPIVASLERDTREITRCSIAIYSYIAIVAGTRLVGSYSSFLSTGGSIAVAFQTTWEALIKLSALLDDFHFFLHRIVRPLRELSFSNVQSRRRDLRPVNSSKIDYVVGSGIHNSTVAHNYLCFINNSGD